MSEIKPKGNSYLRYSGLAIQIVFTILIFIWGGRMLDARFQTDTPWFTLAGAIIGVLGILIYLIRNLSS